MSRGLGDVYKRQFHRIANQPKAYSADARQYFMVIIAILRTGPKAVKKITFPIQAGSGHWSLHRQRSQINLRNEFIRPGIVRNQRRNVILIHDIVTIFTIVQAGICIYSP